MNAGAIIQLSDTFLILSRPSSPLTWKIAIWLVTQTPVSLLSFSIPCSAKIGLPSVTVVNNLPANAQEARDVGLIPGSGRFPWRRKWQPTPVFLPGKFHGQRSLVGYNPRGHKEPDTTEHTHCCSFAQSGPPLCNPMDSIMPYLSVPHHLPKFGQVHAHCIGDVTQPSYPLTPSSLSALNISRIRNFSNESAVRIPWPKYWSFSFSISPSN